MPKKIIIIGGGFGGVRAALDLLKFGKDNLQVILIDKNPYHSFTIDYYETATIIFKEAKSVSREEFLKARSSVAIPFAEIFKSYKGNLEMVVDEFTGADFKDKKVKLKSGKILAYDWLILSPGSEPNFFNIPHLNERALPLKTAEDALNIRNAVDELFLRKAKHEIIKIIVGGGGFTGSELTGELVGYLSYLSEFYGHPEENVEMILIEAGKNLLGGATRWVQEKTKKRLESLGVKILTESLIVDVREKEILIKDNGILPYDVLIWTAGVKANGVVKNLQGVSIEKNGCVRTDEYLRAVPFEEVFAIGDIAYCEDPKTGKLLAMTAQAAIDQARYAARFIAGALASRDSAPYSPAKVSFIIPLGKKYALLDMGFIKIHGIFGWFLKRLAVLEYFLSILPLRRALALWLGGIRIYTGND